MSDRTHATGSVSPAPVRGGSALSARSEKIVRLVAALPCLGVEEERIGNWRWGHETWNAAWPTDFFSYGQLDEVAVYNTALSAQQVAWHYRSNH